jgi:phosphatidylinositol alpha-1,6-mannosyltransferase
MRVLFLSRAHPPVIGGMENQNFELARRLPALHPTKTLANRHGKWLLPLFLPVVLVRALAAMARYDVLLLGDGVLGVVGYAVKRWYGDRKRVVCIAHGLDLTYTLPLYQRLWVGRFLPALDRIVAVGRETLRAGVAAGIPRAKLVFVPNGVDTTRFAPRQVPRAALEAIVGARLAPEEGKLQGKKVLLTAGRLAPRKGVAWFIQEVLPLLPDEIVYVVAGDGEDRDRISAATRTAGMGGRVILLGRVSDEVRDVLFQTCDLFVQPNVRVAGSLEGFGLVVLEAASAGIPVLASRLEGLPDAIHEGRNGFLVEPEDAAAWAARILALLAPDFDGRAFGRAAHAYVSKMFSWDEVVRAYAQVLEGAAAPRS